MLRGTELCEERLWEMGRSRLEKRLWGADSRSAGLQGVCAAGHTAGHQIHTAGVQV